MGKKTREPQWDLKRMFGNIGGISKKSGVKRKSTKRKNRK
jgi:hypothetical protein